MDEFVTKWGYFKMSDFRYQIDFLGDGQMIDLFHPSLSVSYITQEIDLPNMNGDTPTYDVTIPADIVMPMFYVFPYNPKRMCYTFSKVSGSTWRIKFWGQKKRRFDGVRENNYTNPLVINGVHKLVIGGYRG